MNNLYLPPGRSAELLPIDSGPISHYANYGRERYAQRGAMDYWTILLRWKWTVISWAIIGVGAGLLATLIEPRRYEGKTTLEVQDMNDNFLNMKQVSPVNQIASSGAFSDIQTQVKILQSDSVLVPVMGRMPARVAQISPSNESIVARTKRLLGMPTAPATFDYDDAKKLADTMKVRAVGQTRVIEVTADWSDSRVAADFVNQVASEYMDQNIRARWEMGQRTSDSLSRWLEDSKEKLKTSEDALQQYAQKSGLLMTTQNSQKTNVADEKLSQLQDALSKATADRIEAQSRYEMAKSGPLNGLPGDINEGGLLRDYQTKLTELQRQRAELSATYTSDYGKIKRLDSEIASVQAAIATEQHGIIQRAETQYHAASRREKLLSASFADQTGVVTSLDQRSVQYHILEHQVESNQEVYDEMLKQAKQAAIASAMGSSNIRVLDPAQPPTTPYLPKPALSCALGMVLFSFLGVLIGLARERADSSLREPGESNQLLGLPEMGVMLRDANGGGLLHSPDSESFQQAIAQPSFLGAGRLGRGRSDAGQGGLWEYMSNPGASKLGRPPLLALESCRAVVASLLSSSDTAVPRLLVITSPGPGEGKTTVVANLGLTLALIGRRVLLVDADVRRHQLHKFFGLHDDRGLCTILENDHTLIQSLDSYVQKTAVPGLSVLASGASITATANLLYSENLSKLLTRLKENYDFVLVDTPPVFPVADARVVGRFSDGVILVARAGQTAREAASAAHRRLAADDVRVLGLILNDWDPKSSAHTYYGDYTREYTDVES